VTYSKNIVLTGFMGTGKSTVGKEVSERLNREFLDTDKIIEKDEGRTISEIFKENGEIYFRQLEKELVKEIAEKSNLVIATGGGMLLNQDNLSLMSRTGYIFYLYADIDRLINRIGNGKNRPMATEKNRDEIIKLYESRVDCYNILPNRIDTTGRQPSEIAEKIISMYNAFLQKDGNSI